ncbi:OmpA family protein [Faucicola boevrei]|uniref:OmpA family protein n=1 Tax=Faucicola boevrei TaxID=346665 RepID=UPI00037E1FF9|nr:OmpA family protein [Moraxella boevrei]
MKQIKQFAVLSLSALALAGCMGTKHLSRNISDDGRVQHEDITFPELDDAWQKDGQFPNSENLAKIRAGVGKDELYQLIGRPHFSEAQHAREWDYIMKFYHPDESVQICQYKVIFDKDYKGQEFYWKPADCVNYVKPLQPDNPVLPAVVGTPIINEKINLSADALFYFDKFKTQDMLPKGKPELDALAQKLAEYSKKGRLQVMVTGYTDRFGDDMYNMNLSLLRAQTVRSYLVLRGVDAGSIWATGAGETQPVKQCADNSNKKVTIDCLQPNRRVEVQVSVY